MDYQSVPTGSAKTKSKSVQNFSMFDSKESNYFIKEKGLKLLSEKTTISENLITDGKTSEAEETQSNKKNVSNDGRSCILCAVNFVTLEEQRAHFKLDWHKYNIKQMLLKRNTVEEPVFEELISGDVSSISGSDSESDSDEEAILTEKGGECNPLMTVSLLENNKNQGEDNFMMDKSNPKIYFVNSLGNYMSVYREVLFAVKDFSKTAQNIVSKIENLNEEKMWLVLMTGGGHFAGAIFSGNNVVVRKTFHRYTVRAKRGTAQGMRDNKQGGHQPKSAGASLRRYNEAALTQDIQNLLESWSEHVEKCDKVFIRVPNSYKWIFFEGKKPPFKKDDLRVRSIPFATRRATFKELEKVHEKLSTIYIHENFQINDVIKTPKEKFVRKQTENIHDENESVKQKQNIKDDDVIKQQSQTQSVKNNLDNEKGKKISKKDFLGDKRETKTKAKQVIPPEYIELYEAISSGNFQIVKRIAEEIIKSRQELNKSKLNLDCEKTSETTFDNKSVVDSTVKIMEGNMKDLTVCCKLERNIDWLCQDRKDILNEIYEDYGETLLHLASRLTQLEILRTLLEAGADPTIKDCNGRVPFCVAKDKETRNEFRRFMAFFPDKFDYKVAQIPSPLTTEMENDKNKKFAEKKKAQAKARKEKQKAKRAVEKQKEEERKKKEQEKKEKNWFQSLSDREKRAVAAERRLGEICFNCSKSLQGLQPFERLSNKYCSTACVHKHRKKLEGIVT